MPHQKKHTIKNWQEKYTSNVTVVVSLLATLSGSCGLAYEIIYMRLFSNYFGDSFVMSGVILSAVFIGIAFGAWQSTRFIHALAVIEISIGLYAIIAVIAFSYWGFELASFGSNTLFNALKLIILLGLPAFLIGTCVPLFAAYAQSAKPLGGNIFTRIYALYNLGAFLSVLMIEFIMFRQLGIFITGIIIGCINLVIGLVLLGLRASVAVTIKADTDTLIHKRIFIALFMASFASGVFQLYVLRISFLIFGPLHENFAIILTSAILGVTLGSWAALGKRLSFGAALLTLSMGVLIFLTATAVIIDFWASIPSLALSSWGELIAKIALLGGYPLGIFILFGSLVPLALKAHKQERGTINLTGPLLAISGFGNGLGTLFMFVVLYQYFSLLMIGGLISALLFFGYLIFKLKAIRSFQLTGYGMLLIILSITSFQVWPRIDLLFGYEILANSDLIDVHRKSYKDAVTYKAYDQSASLVTLKDQRTMLVFNGYHSLTFGPDSKSSLHETIVGSIPGIFSENTEKALVFGLGTGITAGATARIYKQTKVVEINSAIFNIPQHFIRENNGVMTNKDVDVVLEDGISTLITSSTTYDAIVNTVTSPKYYSSVKLYTQDFYEIVKKRLNNGGIYSSWFDLNINTDGISTMLNTLETSFANCRYFLLSYAYFNVVCGEGTLDYQPINIIEGRMGLAETDELFDEFGFSGGFFNTMTALELDFGSPFFNRTTQNLNTLNLPSIEFVVSRASEQSNTRDILLNFVFANMDFQRRSLSDPQKWQQKCNILRQMSGLHLLQC